MPKPTTCELCGGPLGNMMENILKFGPPYREFFIDTGGCPHCWGETIYGKEPECPDKGPTHVSGA